MEQKTLNQFQVRQLLPDRDPWGHKGSFGKILLLCGSRGFTGAAYLAAMGALRTGAGLTFLGVPESIYAIEAVKLNEPVVFPLPEADYKVSLPVLPAGYAYSSEIQEFSFAQGSKTLTITLKAAE